MHPGTNDTWSYRTCQLVCTKWEIQKTVLQEFIRLDLFKNNFSIKNSFFWLHWVLIAAPRLSLIAVSRASHCGGFSCCGAQALRLAGLVVHVLSCSAACGIFLHQVTPALQGGFLTTAPPGKPQVPSWRGLDKDLSFHWRKVVCLYFLPLCVLRTLMLSSPSPPTEYFPPSFPSHSPQPLFTCPVLSLWSWFQSVDAPINSHEPKG